MAETPPQDVQTLFKRWRSGDADAGVEMAQRFSDWYYAITVMRLGDNNARIPLEKACQVFAQRIMGISSADELIDFAHQIVLEEIRQVGGRSPGGDFPNAMTSNRSPSALLKEAAKALPAEQLQPLHQLYSGKLTLDSESSAELPLVALRARHTLKRWLNENADVPFTCLPPTPDLDRAPLPLYEAVRLANNAEERAFEQWLLTNLDLCKDVAEFAAFAHAMRAGALKDAQDAPLTEQRPSPQPPLQQVAAEQTAPEPTQSGAGKIVAVALGVAVLVGVVLLYLLLQ